jgi:alkanesulfonate monooxygenase SsuD/methylene tetrahydromethanopterin reductase-like flavin-dependent oxidoreductase (luciferase family)
VARGFSVDPDQGLSQQDELRLAELAAELGYDSAWTPSGPDSAAFDRCLRWHQVSGLATGISAVPASGQPPAFYAEHARRVSDSTDGKFTLVVGSGQMGHAAEGMRRYLPELQQHLPSGFPVYLAALGPLMLEVGGALADGVSLNWCSSEQVDWSRKRVERAAKAAGRAVPKIIEYIRTAVDESPELAERTVAAAAARYLANQAYRKHYQRMGVAEDLALVAQSPESAPGRFIHKIGAAGRPGDTNRQFERLAEGLDLAIVRILVVKRGDFASARRVLEECRSR